MACVILCILEDEVVREEVKDSIENCRATLLAFAKLQLYKSVRSLFILE